jgi:hypothetical protein
VRIDEALRILGAPDTIRSNFANMSKWKNSAGRQLNKLTLVEWFRDELKAFTKAAELINKIERANVTMMKVALENMRRANAALPKRLNARDSVTYKQAQTAMCYGYMSGLAKGFTLANKVTDAECQEHDRRQEAIDTINTELNRLQQYISENVLVDGSGNILSPQDELQLFQRIKGKRNLSAAERKRIEEIKLVDKYIAENSRRRLNIRELR